MLSNGINGKIFRLIYNMYQNIKSCISFNGEISSFFLSFRGVRHLSPVLFSIFLNDLETFLASNNCTGIDMNFNYDDLTVFLKIFVLLYADDTIIFGMDEKNFQDNLNVFFEYSEIWKLDINFSKTEVMIFGTKSDDKFEFKLGDNVLSICKEFKYLGVVLAKVGVFIKL